MAEARLALVGCGRMARHHLLLMLAGSPETVYPVVSEPSAANYAAACELFRAAGREPPPNEPDLSRLLAANAGRLDAAFIITPHACHHDQALACLEAGLDVLLEKPMVMNAAEAASLVAAQQRTGRLLVVAFNGSLSPHIRRAADALRSGEFGRLLGISAVVWEDWQPMTAGSWRQQAAVSGGGFLFDTGAHMLNTICDLAGEEFAEVAAWLDNRGAPVEIVAAAIGRLASGALVSLHACGATIPSCHSDVRLFCEGGIIRTGIWGEFLEIQRPDAAFSEPRHLTPTASAWEQFLAVRAGRLANPCPPEVGLRMARLYDAICASAAQGGRPVLVG